MKLVKVSAYLVEEQFRRTALILRNGFNNAVAAGGHQFLRAAHRASQSTPTLGP